MDLEERACFVVSLKVTPAERDALRAMAKGDGTTVSTLLRRQLPRLLDRDPILAGKVCDEMRRCWAELSSAGYALNQIAKALNAEAGQAGEVERHRLLTIAEAVRAHMVAVGKTRTAIAKMACK